MSVPPWRRSLVYGLPWAITITAGEALSLPFDHLSGSEHAAMLGAIFGPWVAAGVGMAYLAFAAERRGLSIGTTWALLLPFSLVCALANNTIHWVYGALHIAPPSVRALGAQLPSWSNFLYIVWMTLFYGALFTVGCMLALRAERTRTLLADAQIARGKTEALLVDAEFDALRACIDPAFLLRAMGEVQRRYAQNAPAADALLDQLVGFLRSAMPCVRGARSTLAVELRLAQAYVELCAQTDPLRGHWRFQIDEVPPEIEFPPLLLLPLLDQLTPLHPIDRAGELRLRVRPGELRLTLHSAAAPARLPQALAYRVRVALRASFGDACSLWVNRAAQPDTPTLVLRVAPARRARRAMLTLVPSSFHKEVSHG